MLLPPLDFEIVNPLLIPNWDSLIMGHPEGTIFHSAPWARVLCESYGYTPLYFAVPGGSRFEAVWPVMEVDSIVTGRRGISLPFTDHCTPILTEGSDASEIWMSILEYGKSAGWKSIQLRCGKVTPTWPPATCHFLHRLDLRGGESAIWSGLRDSTRRNIRKADRIGVKVSIETSREALGLFYRLNCLTRKRHGLPPQPYRFFQKLHDHVISKGYGLVVLAWFGAELAAGAVFVHFGDHAVYKYGASDLRFQEFRANNLVMWEAVREYVQKGFKNLCFGRTEPENTGLLQYKRGWGAAEEVLPYFKYDLRRSSFVGEQPQSNALYNRIFRTMPAPILRLAGEILYRHVA